MSQFHHFGDFFQAVKEVRLDFDVMFIGIVEHLLAVFLAGDEGSFDANIAEDEFLESDGDAV